MTILLFAIWLISGMFTIAYSVNDDKEMALKSMTCMWVFLIFANISMWLIGF